MLKENLIRPEKLKERQLQYIKKDIAFLKKNKKIFIDVNCPSCNEKVNKFFLKKNTFDYKICNYCNTFFMSPRPSIKLLKKFYQTSKNSMFWHKYMFPATDRVRALKIFKPRVNKIIQIAKRLKIKKPSILDVGAGFGTFCVEAKKSKFFSQVTAIEPSENGYKNCIKNDINAYCSTIEEINIKKKFDIVCSFEVIEHLFSVKNYFKKLKKLIKPNGILIVTCPNGNGFDVRFLLKESNTIDHEHLNYFNPESMKIVLEKVNLKLIEISTPGELDVDIVNNFFLKKKNAHISNHFFKTIFNLKNKILRENFQKFLIKNKLSSNMWAIAKF